MNLKTCPKCGNVYPATKEYYSIDKRNTDGLQSNCKECARLWRLANKEKLQKYQQERYQANRSEILEYQRKYQQANPDKLAKYRSEYYQTNRDKIIKQQSEYSQAHRDKKREYDRVYKRANADKVNINKRNREARKRSLPATYTEQQWLICLEYFGYTCAVCGKSHTDITLHADHWIPLNNPDCPGTIATNMVCLCGSCNSSKHDILPDTWLTKRYGVDKANEILTAIETYFQSLT